MENDFSFPYTYSGLLDDVMARYGLDLYDHGPAADRQTFFQRMIAKNLFFAGGIYLNDGYILNHPVARDYLAKNQSLFRAMLGYGFIRVLTRAETADDLAMMPEKMASQNNASFKAMIESSEWKKGFKKVWRKFAYWAFESEIVEHWPRRDMSFGFTELMRRVFKASPENVGVAVPLDTWKSLNEQFLKLKPKLSGPRDKLEKAAIGVISNSQLSPRHQKAALQAIMNVGNQAYHYNFGLCITAEIGSEDDKSRDFRAICVDTTLGKAFDELLQKDEFDEHTLRNIPVFGIPADVHFDKGHAFEPLVDKLSDTYKAKVLYAKALRSAVLGQTGGRKTVKELKEEISDATNLYVDALIDGLKLKKQIPREEFLKDSERLAIKIRTGVISAADASTIAADNPVIAHAVATGVKKNGINFLVSKGVLTPGKPLNLREIRPQISSLRFDRKMAAQFVKNIPRF